MSTMLVTNKTPTGTYRGPGRFEGDFFRERLFDIAAKDLGIDPVVFRRHNLLTKDELPSKLPVLTPVPQQEELDCGDYLQTLDRCLAEFDWSGKAKLKGRLIDGRYHGIGIACFIEGGAVGPRENARMVVEGDGHSLGLCRLCDRWAGTGNHLYADRRRCAGNADRADTDLPWVDNVCAGGLRLVSFALNSNGRLRDHRHGGRAEGNHPHRGGLATELCSGRYRP